MIEPTNKDADVDATEDETFGCGYSYDHTEEFIDEADGIVMLRCTNCDAEWIEDDEDE